MAAQCVPLQSIIHVTSNKCCCSSRRGSQMVMKALPGKEYTMWGDEDADGKDIEFDRGVFEGVVTPKRPQRKLTGAGRRHVIEPIEAPGPGLVPEKWRDLQYELNRTKRERRRDVLNYKLNRTKMAKDKLRERLRVIIDEAIDEEDVEDDEEAEQQNEEGAEVIHTVFEDGKQRTMLYGPDDVEEDEDEDYEDDVQDEQEDDETEAESFADVESDESAEEVGDEADEWPPAAKLPEMDPSPPTSLNLSSSGRAMPVNPRHALENLTLEEISKRMSLEKEAAAKAQANPNEEDVEFSMHEKKLLRRRGADVEKIYCEKWMPLHCLARSGQTNLIAELLTKDERLRIDDLDRDGFTALFRAVEAGRTLAVKQLIKSGANIFFRDKHEATLLHHAVASGNPFVVRVLVRYGVDINSVDKWGWTPLHIAVQCQKKELVRSLLSRGADKTLKNKDGNTPLDLAFAFPRSYDSDTIIKLIKIQKPDVGVMLRYKGCQKVIAKLASEGLVIDTPDQFLVDLSKETGSQLADVREWTQNTRRY